MSEKEKEMQKLIVEYQLLQAALEETEKKEKEILQGKAEIDLVCETISQISGLEEGREILIPLGAGNFVSGYLKQVKSVFVNIGAGVVVEKGVEEAEKILEERKKNLEEALKKLEKEKTKITEKLEEIARKIEEERV